MGAFLNDLQYACRRLWLSPGFTLVVLGTLTLGIGATSSVASAVRAVLFQKLPFPGSERVMLLENFKSEDGGREHFPSSWLDYQDWRLRSRSFEEIAVHSGTSVLLFAVAMVATWHPARRATRVPPTIALRPE